MALKKVNLKIIEPGKGDPNNLIDKTVIELSIEHRKKVRFDYEFESNELTRSVMYNLIFNTKKNKMNLRVFDDLESGDLENNDHSGNFKKINEFIEKNLSDKQVHTMEILIGFHPMHHSELSHTEKSYFATTLNPAIRISFYDKHEEMINEEDYYSFFAENPTHTALISYA